MKSGQVESASRQLLRQLYRYISVQLSALARKTGDSELPLLCPAPPPDPGEAIFGLKLRSRELADCLEFDFAFADPNGFVGYFKAYDDEDWGPLLIQDLHRVALLRQEQVLAGLLTSPVEQPMDKALRPCTHHLFALVPKGESALSAVWEGIRAGRLTEEVGLSLLVCDKQEVAGWQADTTPPMDVRRFIAPLLLQVRRCLHDNTMGDSYHQLIPRLTAEVQVGASAAVGDVDPDRLWAKRWLTTRLQKVTTMSEKGERLRLLSLEDIQLRRFRASTPVLPFDRIVVVEGLNGSGKSTLLEAVELALTGRLQRLDAAAEHEKVHHSAVYSNVLGQKGGRLRVACTDQEVMTINLDSPWDRPTGWMEPFYLRQDRIRRFLESDAAGRYAWVVQSLGIPAETIQDELKKLRTEVRNALSARWSKVTGRQMPSTLGQPLDTLVAHLSRYLESLTAPMERLSVAQAALQQLQVLAGGSLKAPWARRMDDLICGAQGILALLDEDRRRLQDALRKPDISMDWTAAWARVSERVDALACHGRELSGLRQMVEAMVVAVAPAVRAVRARVESTPAPAPEPAQEELRRLEQNLSALSKASRTLATVLQALRTAETLVTEAARLQGLRQALEGMQGLDWIKRPPEWPERAESLLNALDALAREVAPLVRWQEPLLAHRGYVEAVNRDLNELKESLQAQVEYYRRRVAAAAPQATTSSGAGEEDDHDVQEREALARFWANLGLQVDSASLAEREMFRRTIEAYTICQRLVQELPETLSPSPAVMDALEELATWDRQDEDLTRCGLRPLVSLLQVIHEEQERITGAIREFVEELLNKDVEPLWLELVWALTAHSWYYPIPQLAVDRRPQGGATLLRVSSSLGPATAVFNMAEQHILGLAWFFVSYLLVGRHRCNTIILDDPFQYLDDANLMAFVRNFDEIMRAIGAEQLVLAIHQPMVAEYLRHEWGSGELSDWQQRKEGEPHLVIWSVRPVDEITSEVRVRTFRLRHQVPALTPVGEQELAFDMAV